MLTYIKKIIERLLMSSKITEEFVGASLKLADDEHSKATERELEIHGLSSNRLRCFLNNLCSKENTNYLEIGVYRGGTLLSALKGNSSCKATGIDNFKYDPREPKKHAPEGTIWTNVKSQLEDNVNKYRHPDSGINVDNITLITDSFQDVKFNKEDRFNVCFFDVTPVNTAIYDDFFEKIVPHLAFSSVVVFSNYSNARNSVELNEALERHADKFDIEWRMDRISSGLSDATKYYSGILVVGFKKKITTTKQPADKKA